jgi:phenylacetate-CoA ligase
VLTGFANTDQIFIRYRTGDIGEWSSNGCSCGRSTLPVLARVVGRQEDALTLPGGRQMVRFHSLFTERPGIAEGQVVQEALDRFLVNVVPAPTYTNADAEAVEHRFRERFELGPEISVEVRKCDVIPRGANGKFRAVVNLVKGNEVSKPGNPVPVAESH